MTPSTLPSLTRTSNFTFPQVMQLIEVSYAFCETCGHNSKDLKTCQKCRRSLPIDAKITTMRVPAQQPATPAANAQAKEHLGNDRVPKAAKMGSTPAQDRLERQISERGGASGSSKTIQWGAKHVHSIKFPKLDIKLEQNGEVAFNLWYRTIIDAIESQDCAFLLTGEDMPESYNDNERDKRLAAKKLKLFLMSHLDLHYQGMVGNLSDPKEILSVLRKFCEPTSKAFVNNLMQKFARLDFESQVETPLEFINRFDDLVRKIRQINSDVMNEPYIKQTFMGAIRDTHTYQRELDNEAGFGLSQLKNMLIEEFNEIEQMSVLDKSLRTSTLLATGLNQHQMKGSTLRGRGRGVGVLRRGVQKNLGERSSAANEHFHAKTFRGGVNRKIVCYNCGRKGHPFKMCRSKLRVCYNCNQLTTHLAAQCTEPKRNPGLSYTPSSKAKMTANKKVPKVVKMKVGDAKLFQKHLMNTGKPATTFFIAGEADLKENENTWVLMGENEEISLLNFSRERLGQAAMNVSAGKHLTSFRAVIDTGATEHLANRREYFETLRVFETPKRFTCANKDLEADLVCKYYGDIAILNNGKVSRLKNVLYSPELAVNLFSLRKVTGAGMEVIFSKDKAKFVDSSTVSVDLTEDDEEHNSEKAADEKEASSSPLLPGLDKEPEINEDTVSPFHERISGAKNAILSLQVAVWILTKRSIPRMSNGRPFYAELFGSARTKRYLRAK
ncbi:unnamed protein product [Nesidiocoris tenuis]|uniref:CCHC-type domain-containing protein n=1 Tax=Nesidiocoris tenuis TaxID=355587 RepID=A0A6H5GN42_9HEMI|nr:unnamed protein product [Nesidiocoris tenuis]